MPTDEIIIRLFCMVDDHLGRVNKRSNAHLFASEIVTIGREELMGREAVIDRCAKLAKFLETVSTTFTKLKINRAETFVVVEGVVQFQDQENQTSSVASCDVFQFSDERLVEITS
jgi:hypothetical protein